MSVLPLDVKYNFIFPSVVADGIFHHLVLFVSLL